ncbi:MAG: glycoside hydrolase family 6, partial [Anaerolineae bacterium]|nr:glycoside hydrolase family 6 [Anaerolineae bacterium]
MRGRRRLGSVLAVGIVLAVLFAAVPAFGEGLDLDPETQFYVAKPNHGAIEQIAELISSGDKANAGLIEEMIETPQSVWFTGGDPHKVQQDVKNTVKRSAGKKTIPVLVVYNIPFRDCAQFSAGGATTVQEYKDWIDGFAAGIGDEAAVVILEPDGLGIIPWYKQFRGLGSEAGDYEWCQPDEADEATAADER